MSDRELISVVIPLYNSEEYVSETIMSVVKQTYKNWELIIVDDCSNDGSVNAVKNIMSNEKKIKLITSNKTGGAANARNVGIMHSKGEFIAFLDSDDIWAIDKLKLQLEYMKSNNSLMSCTNKKEIDKNGRLLYSKKRQFYNMMFNIFSSYGLKLLLITNQVCTSSVILKRSLLKKQLFDVDRKLVEDYHLWLSLLLSRKLKKVDRIKKDLVFYRIHDKNDSGNYAETMLRTEYSQSKALSKYNYKLPIWLSFIKHTLRSVKI